MTVVECLTRGGLPTGFTHENLSWLASSHRNLAHDRRKDADPARAQWHGRWAAFIEDLLKGHQNGRH